MIKYAEIAGYAGQGEVRPHIYQWVEVDVKEPNVIFVKAYDGPSILYKGKVFFNTREYIPEKIKGNELEDLEKIIGKIGIVKNFNIFNEMTKLIEGEIFVEVKENRK